METASRNEAFDGRLGSKQTYVGLGYNIFDADNHLDGQAPDTWQKRLPEKLKARAPKMVKMPDGRDAWSYDDGKRVVPLRAGTAGLSSENYLRYIDANADISATWDPKVRLRALDLDGVHAAIIFGVGGLGKGLNEYYPKDREMLQACYRAYNDWVMEEYCQPSGGRLFSVAGLPWSGVEDAVAEMERCMKKGHAAINLGTFPSGNQMPTEADDYFWAAAQDMNVPLTIHVSNGFLDNPSGMDKKNGFGVAHKCGASTINTVDVLLGQGIPERFPKIKIGLIEANIGWIPHFLEQIDYYYFAHRLDNGKSHLKMTPSEMFKQSFWTSFMWDPIGVALRHHVGVDRVMWSTDFPHSGGEWPRSRLQMEALFRGVPDDEMKLMLHDNLSTFLNVQGV